MVGFPLGSYRIAAALTFLTASQVGKTFAQEMHDRTLEEDGWLRSKTEGYDYWVRNDGKAFNRHPSDFFLTLKQVQDRAKHKPFKTPDSSPMTLKQFCQKYYPLPEVTPEMISFAIGNGLREKGLLKNMFTTVSTVVFRERMHDKFYNEFIRDWVSANKRK